MRVIELEKERLSFIEDRDGKQAAIEFAKRTMGLYRRNVLKYKGLMARKSFIISYLEFKSYYLKACADDKATKKTRITASRIRKAWRLLLRYTKAQVDSLRRN